MKRKDSMRVERQCAKPGCNRLITQPRIWLCDEHEEAYQQAVERAEKRRQEEGK